MFYDNVLLIKLLSLTNVRIKVLEKTLTGLLLRLMKNVV